MQNNKPAILGGKPLFEKPIPITEPTLPTYSALKSGIQSIINSRRITNDAFVKEFENKVKKYIGCQHAIALNSCTSGLMILLRALGVTGEVILPSFTFYATGHAILWNSLTPVFVDCDPKTYTIDPARVEQAITPKTSAIVGVHIFGNVADIEALERIAQKHKVRLIFDAAHALGSTYKGKKVGNFGDAECFSLSPTKLVTASEGGIITTNDDELAKKIRLGRTYGDPGNYDCDYLGLSARMPELNALLGVESLKMLDDNIKKRNLLANLYKKILSKTLGIDFQKIDKKNKSTFKDFSIQINERVFGMSRDNLAAALNKENIMTKKYFYPPLHKQKIFSKYYRQNKNLLKETEKISNSCLSLPLYSHMDEKEARKVCKAIDRIVKYADEIRVIGN